jgi:hypothetical protein
MLAALGLHDTIRSSHSPFRQGDIGQLLGMGVDMRLAILWAAGIVVPGFA